MPTAAPARNGTTGEEVDRSHVRNRPLEMARAFGQTEGALAIYSEAYKRGCNLSQYLEQEDPTDEWEAEERDLDAFERVLQAADIQTQYDPVTGIHASTWEHCIRDQAAPERKALMPEFFSRVWRRSSSLAPDEKKAIMGANLSPSEQRAILLSGDAAINTLVNPWYDNPEIRAKRLVPPIPLEAIVARTNGLDGDGYRTLYIVDHFGTDAYRLKRVVEGTQIPATSIITGEHTLRIHKFGRAIRATYEQLRRQRVDRIAFLISRMAIQAEVDKVGDAINTVINGDGNANTSAIVLNMVADGLDTITPAVAGTLTLRAWMTFRLRFALTYAPNIVIGSEQAIAQLLTLPVGQGVGLIPLALMPANPFGVVGPIAQQLAGGIRYGISTVVAGNRLLAFQSDNVIEMVTEIGGNVAEVERFITNQTQIMTMTEVVGFGVIDPFGSRILNLAA